MSCSFCEIKETDSYWQKYCKPCADLKRLLVLHDPEKCIEILKRVLLRNPDQINNKILLEIKGSEKTKVK